MTRTPTKLEEYLSSAIAGSLVGQIAIHRGTDLKGLIHSHMSGGPSQVNALADEIANLGLDPDLLAAHTLGALVALFMQPENAELLTAQFTGLLWSILGDPKNGGGPPPIYRKAGSALHLTLLGILDPHLIDPPADA